MAAHRLPDQTACSGHPLSRLPQTPNWVRKPTVEIVGRADERQMGQRLRKLARRARQQTEFFRKQSKMVRVAKPLCHRQPRLVEAAGARQTLNEPESAGSKSTFAAL